MPTRRRAASRSSRARATPNRSTPTRRPSRAAKSTKADRWRPFQGQSGARFPDNRLVMCAAQIGQKEAPVVRIAQFLVGRKRPLATWPAPSNVPISDGSQAQVGLWCRQLGNVVPWSVARHRHGVFEGFFSLLMLTQCFGSGSPVPLSSYSSWSPSAWPISWAMTAPPSGVGAVHTTDGLLVTSARAGATVHRGVADHDRHSGADPCVGEQWTNVVRLERVANPYLVAGDQAAIAA